MEVHNLELQEQNAKLEKELKEKAKEMKGTMTLSRVKLFQELRKIHSSLRSKEKCLKYPSLKRYSSETYSI